LRISFGISYTNYRRSIVNRYDFKIIVRREEVKINAKYIEPIKTCSKRNKDKQALVLIFLLLMRHV